MRRLFFCLECTKKVLLPSGIYQYLMPVMI